MNMPQTTIYPTINFLFNRFYSLLIVILLGTPFAQAELGDAIYTLDPQAYYNSHPNSPDHRYVLEVVPEGLKVTLPPDTPNWFYHFLVKDAGLFDGGEQYTAVVTFKTVTSTNHPNKFYMYARPNGSGMSEYDIWEEWVGEPGESSRTISMPMDLTSYDQANWAFYIGVFGPGSFIVESLVIYEGMTFDRVAAVNDVASVNNAVSGVSAATGASSFTVTPPATPTNVVTVSGLVSNSTGSALANRSTLQSAINNAQSPTTLKIPTGTYYFEANASITLNNIDDLTIDGQGSTFIFRNNTAPDSAFLFLNTDRIVIKDLTFDWDASNKPISSLGVVSNLSADKKQCDFTFPFLNASETAVTASSTWLKIFSMDQDKLVRNANSIYDAGGVSKSAVSGVNTIQATFPNAMALENGETYCIRHYYYEMVCFKLFSSTHTVFDNVHIRSFPGMGWLVVNASHDIVLTGCSIAREAGSKIPLTTSADGFHVSESQGNILIEDTVFQGMGDDAINIHDNCYQGYAEIDPNDAKKVTLKYCYTHQLRMSDGDTLELYNPDYSNIGGGAATIERVVASSALNGNDMTITFQTDLPPTFSPYSIFRNKKFGTTDVIVRNCEFVQTNGHGLLYSGEDVTIENNLFQDIYSTPIQLEVNIFAQKIGSYTYWYEGRPTDNVLISNNTFLDNNAQLESDASAIWAAPTLPWGTIDNYLFTRVTVENNVFSGIPGAIVSLENASNVLVRDNEFIYYGEVPNSTSNFGAILIKKSKDLSLGGNDWFEFTPSSHPYGVVYDTTTTSNFSAATNAIHDASGFAMEDFEAYTNGSAFTTGQALGAVGNGWAYPWRTAGSYSFPTGTVSNASAIDGAQSLSVEIDSWSGKSSSSGAVTRAFDATQLEDDGYILQFSIQPDTLLSNTQIRLTETQNRAAAPDYTSAWEIASLNGNWQVYDAALSAYIDSQMAITTGQIYDITIMLNPSAGIWSVEIANGTSSVQIHNLVPRFSSYNLGTGEAIGGRWLNFGGREIVTGGSTVGATVAFTIDSINIQVLPPFAEDAFEGYANGSSFSTSQALSSVGEGWTYPWRTSGSYAIPTGTVSNANPLAGSQSLSVEVETLPGHTSASGAVTRAYDATQLANSVYSTSFTYRVDSLPSNVKYAMSDAQMRATEPNSSCAWIISSENGSWQAFDGGSSNVYVDTGIAVTLGQDYDVTVVLDADSGLWDLHLSNGSTNSHLYGLSSRYGSYSTDSTEAVGGRWVNFSAKEIVSGASLGATGNFTVDSLKIQTP